MLAVELLVALPLVPVVPSPPPPPPPELEADELQAKGTAMAAMPRNNATFVTSKLPSGSRSGASQWGQRASEARA